MSERKFIDNGDICVNKKESSFKAHVEKDMPQKYNEVTQNFMQNILEERNKLGESFPLVNLLIEQAMERVYTTGQIPGKELYADVFKQKPLKVTQKVFLPLKEFPFNFTGKLLGPRGNTLRRLQEKTQCRIVIKGRNSIRDSQREEELRNSGDPKYAHFHRELYLEISAIAQPAESYARIAYALAELRKYINPDKNDEVSQEQLREMMKIDPEMAKPYAVHVAPEYIFTRPEEKGFSYKKPETFYKRQLQPFEYLPSRARPYNSAPKRFDSIIYATETKRGRGDFPSVFNGGYRQHRY